jgi:hypothetical protein
LPNVRRKNIDHWKRALFMTMDGLWTVEFGSNTGISGGGVAVLRDGIILGGDSTHYYVGEYTFQSNSFRAFLSISAFVSGAQSVFGTFGQEIVIDLQGSLTSPDLAIAQGNPRGLTGINFGAKLTRRK